MPDRYPVRIAIVCFFAFSLMGCAAGIFSNYGNFKTSQEVTDAFETYRVLPGYNYYFVGPDARPNAIIGIKKEYTLESDIWKHVDMTPERLKFWINQMNYQSFPAMLYGNYILDAAGNNIGIWYSLWDTTVVQAGEDKKVTVFLPQGGPLEKRFHAIDLADY